MFYKLFSVLSCWGVAKRYGLFNTYLYIVSKCLWILMILLWWLWPWDGLLILIYIIWYNDTHDFMVMVVVATRPLWSNLSRGCTVGILWSSCRGCLGRWFKLSKRGKVCHGVATWLILTNTSVGQSCIHYFSFLIFKTYMYYVLKIYMYYERNIGGLWLRPNWRY